MSTSSAEQGMVRSKALMTSGWRTPRRPMLFPPKKISAQRPGKKVESEPERGRERKCLLFISLYKKMLKTYKVQESLTF